MAMESWFQKASLEQCDALLALQLDYRFEGDVFASVWWSHFKRLGFRHTGTAYELPSSFPHSTVDTDTSADSGETKSQILKKECVVNEMYRILDSLSVPQLVSSFQREHDAHSYYSLSSSSTIDPKQLPVAEINWWKRMRKELIFAAFHSNIEKQNNKNQHWQEASRKGREMGSRRRKTRSTTSKTDKVEKARRSNKSFPTDAGAELYICKTNKRAKHKGKSKPSGGRGGCEVAFPSIDQYVTYAQGYHNDDLKVVEDSIAQAFHEWRFILSTNQSLLLYGVGSKISLFNKFIAQELRQAGDVIAINGFDKTITVEAVLDLMVQQLLGGQEPRMDVQRVSLLEHSDGITSGIMYARQGDPAIVQRATAIGEALSQKVLGTLRPVYLVVHSIDGVGLRNPTAQEALAGLVYHSRTIESGQNAVRLAASVDHVNGPMLLWDPTVTASFQWVWRRASTLRPYLDEILKSDLYDDQKTPKGSKAEARALLEQEQRQLLQDRGDAESTFDILASFAPRLTQSLHQLVQLQLEEKVDWVEYTDLFRKCKLNFTVSSDHQLRTFLGELIDHNVVVVKNDQRPPLYRVPYSDAGLRKILNFKHRKG